MMRVSTTALVAATVWFAQPAFAQTTTAMDVSVGADVSRSPVYDLARSTDGGASVGVYVSARPRLDYVNGRDRVSLRGEFGYRQYLRHYGHEDHERASIAASRVVNDRLTINGGLGGGSSTSRSFNYGGEFIGLEDPETPLPPGSDILDDATLAGERVRQNTVDGYVGAVYRPNQQSSVGLSIDSSYRDFSGRDNVLPGGGSRDSIYSSARLNYSRSVSPRTSINVSVQGGYANYLHTRQGDGTIITPMIGFSTQLSPTMTFSLSGGASFSRSRLFDGSHYSSTSFAGQTQLCQRGAQSTMCFGASRQAQPSSLGEIGNSTVGTFGYTRRLNRRDTWGLNASYNRTSVPKQLYTNGKGETYSASTRFSRAFNDRISGFISAGVAHVNRDASYNRTDVRGGVGLTFRFGGR